MRAARQCVYAENRKIADQCGNQDGRCEINQYGSLWCQALFYGKLPLLGKHKQYNIANRKEDANTKENNCGGT